MDESITGNNGLLLTRVLILFLIPVFIPEIALLIKVELLSYSSVHAGHALLHGIFLEIKAFSRNSHSSFSLIVLVDGKAVEQFATQNSQDLPTVASIVAAVLHRTQLLLQKFSLHSLEKH